MSIQVTRQGRAARLKVVLVAAALAVAVTVLAIQLSAVWPGPGSSARAPVTEAPGIAATIRELPHPGAHRGQVRFEPVPRRVPSSPHPRGPHGRPKWGACPSELGACGA